MNCRWTDAARARLRELLRQRLSMGTIARDLGTTRGAVAGQIYRWLRGNDDYRPARVRSKNGERPLILDKKSLHLAVGFVAKLAVAGPPLKPSPPPKPLSDDLVPKLTWCSLFDLTNATCRWPVGPNGSGLFCGRHQADLHNHIPYCRAHMARGYNW